MISQEYKNKKIFKKITSSFEELIFRRKILALAIKNSIKDIEQSFNFNWRKDKTAELAEFLIPIKKK